MTKLDKLRGMLVGLAVGDALGASVEFMERGTFKPVTGYRSGGPHNLEAGYWTDDTSMALCTAASLIQLNKHDLEDQMERYRRWYREGYMSSTGTCFDIGNQTRRAIERFEKYGPESYICKFAEDEGRAGNGALMRLAPAVIKHHSDLDAAIEAAATNASLTHSDKRCLDANRVFTYLLIRAINESDKSEVLDPDYIFEHFLGDLELDDEVGCVVNGSYADLAESEIKSSGYVVHSLQAALWAFHNASSFEDGAKLAVNLGGDSDTIGAIYGQIAGAFWGYKAIPHDWVKDLYDYKRIVTFADLLASGLTDDHLETIIKHSHPSPPPKPLTPAEIMKQVGNQTGVANRYCWNDLKEMPPRHEVIALGCTFNEKVLAAIKKGWIPDEMEEKMFMYYENDQLHMHRSWTGCSVFIVQFKGNIAESAMINYDVYQPLVKDPENTKTEVKDWLNALIRRNTDPDTYRHYQKPELINITDQNLIYKLAEELQTQGIFSWSEVEQFNIKLFVNPFMSNATICKVLTPAVERWQQRYASAVYAYKPAKDMFERSRASGDAVLIANAENSFKECKQEKDALEMFTKDLDSFAPFYELMSQLVDYDDENLEKLSLFARQLYPILREKMDNMMIKSYGNTSRRERY